MKEFAKISEKDVTNAIIENFTSEILSCTSSDVIVVGGGPIGLMVARILAKKDLKHWLSKSIITLVEDTG
ncbi:hypothetical protein [Methanohalobium evestigatum]|uniref:hypothetical protein n=1 Tax=Methanohalobium evestigatum TaxID=2322 RepID=UPI0018DD2F70|nr:hypothetical protein [Methanohalobium evestigatum]